jgi:hypothetical protein
VRDAFLLAPIDSNEARLVVYAVRNSAIRNST